MFGTPRARMTACMERVRVRTRTGRVRDEIVLGLYLEGMVVSRSR